MYIPHFVYPFICETYLSYFRLFVIVNSVSVNVGV